MWVQNTWKQRRTNTTHAAASVKKSPSLEQNLPRYKSEGRRPNCRYPPPVPQNCQRGRSFPSCLWGYHFECGVMFWDFINWARTGIKNTCAKRRILCSCHHMPSFQFRYGLSAAHCFASYTPTQLQTEIFAVVGLLYGCKANFSPKDYYDQQSINRVEHHPDYKGPAARDIGLKWQCVDNYRYLSSLIYHVIRTRFRYLCTGTYTLPSARYDLSALLKTAVPVGSPLGEKLSLLILQSKALRQNSGTAIS